MKKTSANNNSRPAVRNAKTPSQLGTRTTGTKKAPATRSAASAKKSKKKGPVVAIVVGALAIVAVVGLVIWAVTTNGFKPEEKYTLTNSDGTTIELTEAELRNALTGDVFADGIIINGVNVSGLTVDAARETVRANEPEAPLALNISLNLDNNIIPVDLSSLPLESNIEDILAEAFANGRPSAEASAEELINCYNQREALKLTPAEYNTAYTVNSDGINSLIHGILDPMAVECIEAQITGFDTTRLEFEYTPSQTGYEINVDKAANDVKALLDSCVYEGVVVVEAQVTEPTLSTEVIQNEYGRISYSESHTTSNNNRNHNIRITCEKIDGYLMQPGEYFSFNEYIGQRTAASGYMEAGTIQGNRIEQDFGGGICQVSSMIYQSVIKADLQIVERNPHRWPSTYADEGTDAAVDWPSQDFYFVNNSDYPVAIHATYDNDNYVVAVSIYGHLFDDGVYIDFVGGERVSTTSCSTVYVADPNLSVGQTETTSGHNGIVARSYQVWYDANGNEINRIQLRDTVYDNIPTTINVGVRKPDGSLATIDTTTGAVIGAETEPSVTETTPSETAAPTETQPTTPPTDPSVTDPPPTDPAPVTEAPPAEQ